MRSWLLVLLVLAAAAVCCVVPIFSDLQPLEVVGEEAVEEASSLAPAGSTSLWRGELPIVTVTHGDCPEYIGLSLREVTERNGYVVLMGDSESCREAARQSNSNFVSHVRYYESDAEAYGPNHVLMDPIKLSHIRRYRIMRLWMRDEGISRVFSRDADTLIYVNVTEALASITDQISVVSIPPRQSSHFSYWSLEALEDYCEFLRGLLDKGVWHEGDSEFVINEMFATRLYSFSHLPIDKRECWGFQKNRGAKACAELWERFFPRNERFDMVRERLPRPKFTPGNLALPIRGMMWDNNFDQDWEWGLFKTTNGTRYKLVEWRDNLPYFVINPARLPPPPSPPSVDASSSSSAPPKAKRKEEEAESVVLAAGLHFQGKKKQHLHHYTTWDKTWLDRCRCSTLDCTNCRQ